MNKTMHICLCSSIFPDISGIEMFMQKNNLIYVFPKESVPKKSKELTHFLSLSSPQELFEFIAKKIKDSNVIIEGDFNIIRINNINSFNKVSLKNLILLGKASKDKKYPSYFSNSSIENCFIHLKFGKENSISNEKIKILQNSVIKDSIFYINKAILRKKDEILKPKIIENTLFVAEGSKGRCFLFYVNKKEVINFNMRTLKEYLKNKRKIFGKNNQVIEEIILKGL